MNLSALARSLSNSLKSAVNFKKRVENVMLPADDESLSIPSTSSSIDHLKDCDVNPRRLNQAVVQLTQPCRQPYKQTVDEILQKVSELEHTLYEDQQQEFKLRMALEGQSERIHELNFSLDTEKQRNVRLVQLLRGMDSDSSSESDSNTQVLNDMRAHCKGEMFESISPVLMQQRYAELSASHRRTHRQLAKKQKEIKLLQCDLEELHGNYDTLCDDFQSEQRRLAGIYARYLHMQQKKKQQISMLKEALGYASDCIMHAQEAIESCVPGTGIDDTHLTRFKIHLDFFMHSLRNCCCVRKLQLLQQEQGVDVDEVLLHQQLENNSSAPPVGSDSKCLLPSKRRQRKHHKQ